MEEMRVRGFGFFCQLGKTRVMCVMWSCVPIISIILKNE